MSVLQIKRACAVYEPSSSSRSSHSLSNVTAFSRTLCGFTDERTRPTRRIPESSSTRPVTHRSDSNTLKHRRGGGMGRRPARVGIPEQLPGKPLGNFDSPGGFWGKRRQCGFSQGAESQERLRLRGPRCLHHRHHYHYPPPRLQTGTRHHIRTASGHAARDALRHTHTLTHTTALLFRLQSLTRREDKMFSNAL